MPNLVFELVRQVHTLVSCQNRHNPTDAEWDDWLACGTAALQTSATPHRALVVTDGGHPSRAQQARLAAALRGDRAVTAVLSSASSLRFVVSALTFANPDIRCFGPQQMAAAVHHLGLSTSDQAILSAAIERLRQRLT